MKIYVTKSHVKFEMGPMTIKVPVKDALLLKGTRIVGIRMPATGVMVPITMLLQSGVKIQIDPKVPYHL